MQKKITCPLCQKCELEYRATPPNYLARENVTHAYICPDCPFVGFEYYTDKDIQNLKELLNN